MPIERDEIQLMTVRLPPGEEVSVEMRYEMGAVERVGAILSLAALVGLGAWAMGLLYRREKSKGETSATVQ